MRGRGIRIPDADSRPSGPTELASCATPGRSAQAEGAPLMIETVVESIRVSLVTQNRVVILKEVDGDRHLPIWIGAYEA